MKSGAHRERLSRKRKSVIYSESMAGHEVTLTVGEYDDGTCGEIFIDLGKEGSDVSGWANAFAISVSLGLQHGIPVDKMVHTFKDMKFGAKDESYTSIPDLVMKTLEMEYCNG